MSDSVGKAYATLELRPDASVDEVKASYRKLAKLHHPDLNADNPNATETFKRITSAYTQALLASSKRAREQPAASASGVGAQGTYQPYGARGATPRSGGPSSTSHGQTVDGRRFNVREWEYHHYGMHGGTEQQHSFDERARAASQSQYVRNLARQQRMRTARMQQRAAAARKAGGTGSAGAAVLSVLFCATVWFSVGASAKSRFR